MFNAFGRMVGGGAGATPAKVAASRAAARAAAGGPSNPFDDPTLVYRDPNNEDSSSDEEDTSGPPAAPSPRRAVPPRLLGPGFPPNLPPFPGPPPPPAAAASGRAAAAIAAAAAAAAAATGPPADAAPSFAGAPSTLDPTAAATAAEVAAAAAAAGIDLRPRRHRTPEERAARDHAKLLASLRSISIPLTGRGAVEKTLKPDAVKNLPDYHGAKLLQGVRTEQDVTKWVERFISYKETQKVTAPHDICHYAFLSLRGEAHALATSLRQAGTWPTSFTGIAQVLLEHFAPPAAFEDSCRAVVDLKQGAKETSKAYILRGRRTLQQLSTLNGQVRRTRAISVDGSSGASAAPLPELQECLFLTILEGGLLPGLRQQMRLQTHSRFNEEEMNSTATNGASSANFMPPQHGSPSPFNSSPSADYVDDDTSLNYGNNNQGNGNRNGSGRRPYRGNRHGDNSCPQSAPTPQGGNSALRFAPTAGATSALTPSRDRSQQRQQAPPPRPSTLNPSSGERPQDARRQLPSRGPNNSGTPGAAQQRPLAAHHGSVNLGAPAYLRATAFTDPCVIPVGMPSHWRTDDLYKMFGYDAGATLATVKVIIGSGADALDLSAAVVDTGAGNVYIRTREAESYFSLLPVADRPRVFLMPEDITRQHMPIFHAGSDVMDNRRHLMLPIAFEGRDAHPGLPRAANAPAEPLRQVSYLTHCIMVDDLPAALVLGNSFFVRNRMSSNPYTGYLHIVRPVLATPDDPRREFGIYGVGENRSLHLNRRRMEWRPFDIELNAIGGHQPFSAVRHGSGGITDAVLPSYTPEEPHVARTGALTLMHAVKIGRGSLRGGIIHLTVRADDPPRQRSRVLVLLQHPCLGGEHHVSPLATGFQLLNAQEPHDMDEAGYVQLQLRALSGQRERFTLPPGHLVAALKLLRDASADEPGDYGGLPLPAPRLGRPSHIPASSHRPVASANMTAAGSPRYFAVPAQHGADDVDMLDFSDAPPRRSAHHAQAVQNSARGRAPRREGQAERTPRADASRHPRHGSPPPPDYARQAYIAPAHDSPRRSSARERSRDQPVRQHNRRRSTHERSRDQRALQHDHCLNNCQCENMCNRQLLVQAIQRWLRQQATESDLL
ncbi:hypothetical protein JKP88DRAFT_245401 [Tribonema minus]|uniref:Uncharacterized protein n=1 Tax=Tribonema minus TaxID=303371 RepID=A0A835YXZ1_9STRA|nr:hypothetical protein JKP88DRAFT_245401 [Tribonema minus]